MAASESVAKYVRPVFAYDYMEKKNVGIALSETQVAHIDKVTEMRKNLKKHQREIEFGHASERFSWTDENGGTWSYTILDDTYARIEGFDGPGRRLGIPSAINDLPVVAIGTTALAFDYCIEEIICPDSIAYIGSGAFRGDTSLRRLVLPAGTGEFKSDWIAQCTNLEELVLPGMLETIARGIFASEKLTRLVVGVNAHEIEPGAFQSSRLLEIQIDDNNPFLTTDGDAVYTKDYAVLLALARPVSSLSVMPGCVRIERKCCHGFTGLRDIQLPDSIVDIAPFAFSGTGITRFEAPASLKTIGEKAFMNCHSLTDVQLNNGLEIIGDSAFEGSAISELAIPASIEQVGTSITRHTHVVHSGPQCSLTIDEQCEAHFLDGDGGLYRREADGPHLIQLVDADMKSYNVFDGAIAIDDLAFAYHDSIESVRVPASVKTIGRSAFRVCKKLRQVILADSVESIGEEAFFDTNLEAFRVPAALRELGSRALVTFGAHHHDKIPSLTRIEVAPGNTSFYIACGMLCRKTESGASVVAYDESCSRVEFPEEITRVEDYAFSNARGIEYLALNPRLVTIGTNGLSTSCWIRHIHIELAKPIEGRSTFDFLFPNTPGAVRGIALGFGYANWVNVPSIAEQLDICLANAHDYNSPDNPSNISAYEQARFILGRLEDPVMLTRGARDMMEFILRNHIQDICVDVALHDDRTVFDALIKQGYVNSENLDEVIERVTKLRDAVSTAYLLEAKRERFGKQKRDYDL